MAKKSGKFQGAGKPMKATKGTSCNQNGCQKKGKKAC